MRIGIAKADPSGRIYGTVGAIGLAPFVLDLVKIENPRDRSPDWELRCGSERCGALWKRKSRDGGVEFLSGPLESPVFPGGKIEIAIFKAKEEGRRGELDITWNPPRADRSETPAASGAPSVSAPATGGGEDDDDIPF